MSERERVARLLREADAAVLQARDAAEKRAPVSYAWFYADHERFLSMADAILADRQAPRP